MNSNKIEIIISGNLTGFTHFYATQGVKDLYTESEINFDYRNHFDFLKLNGERVYALSFASKIVAVSLVTRILDSSRRPGILVVSALLPRGRKVASAASPGSDKALYDLLNALNGRFCERNLMEDMLNPSLSVLRQDYYSDILSGYQLVPDPGQRRLNADAASLQKGAGYVAAAERAMPAYLASPFRQSYEGYPHVFFAPNAPANIDEPEKEEVMYRVRVKNADTNTGWMLPGEIRSTDKIYRLDPGNWQLPIENLDYTYEEVLRGEAGQVRATVGIDGILDITYNFAPKTKEITFVFKKKGGKTLPFDEVAPVRIIEKKSGANYPLPSATYEFRGQEIEGEKALESEGYFIEPASLDLSRCGEECIMTVERKSHLSIRFPAPYDGVPKRITVKRVGTDRPIQDGDVRGSFSLDVPGKREEWEYKIEAEGYEALSGTFPAEGEVRLNLKKRKSEAVSRSPSGQRPGNVQILDGGTRGSGSAEGRAVSVRHIDGGGDNGKRKKGNARIRKLLPFLIALPVLALAVGLGIYWLSGITGRIGESDEKPLPDSTSVRKTVIVKYKDLTGYVLSDDFNDEANVTLHLNYDRAKRTIKYEGERRAGNPINLTASKACSDTVGFFATFDDILLGDTLKIAFDSFEEDTAIYYPLNVNTSDLELYRKMVNLRSSDGRMIKGDDLYNEYSEKKERKKGAWDDVNGNPGFVHAIDSLYEGVKPVDSEYKAEIDEKIIEELAAVDITEKRIFEIKEILKNAGVYGTVRCSDDKNVLVKNRIAALEGAISTLKYGYPKKDPKRGYWPTVENLSAEQKKCIEDFFKKTYANRPIEAEVKKYGDTGNWDKSEIDNIESIIKYMEEKINGRKS